MRIAIVIIYLCFLAGCEQNKVPDIVVVRNHSLQFALTRIRLYSSNTPLRVFISRDEFPGSTISTYNIKLLDASSLSKAANGGVVLPSGPGAYFVFSEIKSVSDSVITLLVGFSDASQTGEIYKLVFIKIDQRWIIKETILFSKL